MLFARKPHKKKCSYFFLFFLFCSFLTVINLSYDKYISVFIFNVYILWRWGELCVYASLFCLFVISHMFSRNARHTMVCLSSCVRWEKAKWGYDFCFVWENLNEYKNPRQFRKINKGKKDCEGFGVFFPLKFWIGSVQCLR